MRTLMNLPCKVIAGREEDIRIEDRHSYDSAYTHAAVERVRLQMWDEREAVRMFQGMGREGFESILFEQLLRFVYGKVERDCREGTGSGCCKQRPVSSPLPPTLSLLTSALGICPSFIRGLHS